MTYPRCFSFPNLISHLRKAFQQRHTAGRISQRTAVEGRRVASLYGAKKALERDSIIDGIREGREEALVTTNVIAQGVDVLHVDAVVNNDLPLLKSETIGVIGMAFGRTSGSAPMSY